MAILDRMRTRNEDSKVVRPFAFFRAGNQAHSNPNQRPILVLEDVFKYHKPDVPTLRGVNLSIERGEFVFVTGPSGAGMTESLYDRRLSHAYLGQ